MHYCLRGMSVGLVYPLVYLKVADINFAKAADINFEESLKDWAISDRHLTFEFDLESLSTSMCIVH